MRQASLPSPVDPIARAAALVPVFAARAAEHDATGRAPADNIRDLAAAGLLSLTVPVHEGGLGAGLQVAQAVIGTLARGCASTALITTMHFAQQAQIATERSLAPDFARRLQRESLDGPALINALQVEPDLGSPSRGGLPATIARRTADGWRLSGHKLYCTGAPLLRWMNVLAVTDEPEPRLGQFYVEAGSPGIAIRESWNPIGMRATNSHEITFSGVPVPQSHVGELTPAAQGLRRNPQTMAWYFGLCGALYDGIARAARDWFVDFLKSRVPSNLGAPLASVPRLQEALGGIELRLATNAAVLEHHARAHAEGRLDPATAGLAKYVVVDHAVAITGEILELAGNHGLSRDNPVERHHRDALCGRVQNPQNDILRLNAGRAALGLARSAAAPVVVLAGRGRITADPQSSPELARSAD